MNLPPRCEPQAQERRGLSKLQRAILVLALTNGEKHPEHGCVISRREVLQAHYGWQPVRVGHRRSSPVFSRSQIGLLRYRAAQVSLSKAVKRLVGRGLLDQSPQSMMLTEAGIKAAEALAARNG